MDHDTKPNHCEPPGFEPTPKKPKAVVCPLWYYDDVVTLCPPPPHPTQRWAISGMFGASRPSLGFEPPTRGTDVRCPATGLCLAAQRLHTKTRLTRTNRGTHLPHTHGTQCAISKALIRGLGGGATIPPSLGYTIF